MTKKILKTILLSILCIGMTISLIACAQKKEELNEDYIVIGKVCTLSGSMNRYGVGSPEVEEMAVKEINDEGGIFISEKNKKMKIKFILEDSHSTADGASKAATKLIEEDNVDIIIVSDTEKIVTPVSEVCEQKGIPCISMNARNDAWIEKGPYDYSFNAAYEIEGLMDAAAPLWKKAGVNNLALLAPDTEYGRTTSEKVKEYCLYNKINLIDFGRFIEGITDYENTISLLKDAEVDGLLCFMDNSDFEVFYTQAKENKLKVKQILLINDSYMDTDIKTMGREEGFASGICSSLIWREDFPYISSLNSKSSSALKSWWESNFSSSCPQMLGIKYANVEVAIDILKRAQSIDSDKIVKAAKTTSLETVIGKICFDENHQAILPVVMCQWNFDSNDGTWTQEIIENGQNSDIMTTGQLKILN